MPRLLLVLPVLLSSAGVVHAQDISCTSVPKTMPLRASVLAPVASELVSPSEELGIAGGVLVRAYDESQSVDQVLLRMRIESCKQVATIMPRASVVDPLDPATYKPRTQFDNAPWRFNMNQNGKNMTADEFSAWMKSRGVRVARGSTPVLAPAVPVNGAPVDSAFPAGTAPIPAAQPAVPGAIPPNSPPGTLPSSTPQVVPATPPGQ